MINQQLLTYIQNQQEAGTDDAKIKANLQSAGWREEDIDEGFQAVGGDAPGDNSTEAHQEMRAEAAKERGAGAAADKTDASQGSDDGSTETESADTYREPVTESDQEGPAGGSDASDLSPIDGNTGDGGNGKTKQMGGESETATDNSESSPADEESVSDSGPDEITESDSADSPLDSDESIHKMKGKDDGEGDDVGPVAVRTFSSDRQRAGMSGSGGIDIQKDQPDRKKMATAGSGVNLPDNEADPKRGDNTPDKSQPEKNKQTQGSSPATQGGQPKKPETMLDGNKKPSQANDGLDKPKKPDSPIQQEAAKVGGQKESVSSGMQSPDGAGKRFSASENVEQAKKRAAARKAERQSRKSSGSSSNLISILIFVVALALVGGGGYYAYMTFFQSSSSDTSASAIMQSLADAGSFNFRTSIETASPSGGPENQLIIEGAIDLNQDTSTQSYYTVTDPSEGVPIQTIIAETENIGTVPAAQQETIRDLLLSPEFFSVGEFQTQERLGQTQNSNGFPTNRFSVSANPTQFVSDYATFHQAFFDTPLSQTVLSRLQKYVGGFEPTQGQAWVDPETGVPYQITFIGTGSEGQNAQINIQFKNHGAELAASPSYEPRSIEQVLNTYFEDSVATQDGMSQSTDTPPPPESDDTSQPDDQPTEQDQPATTSQPDDQPADDQPATTTEMDDSSEEEEDTDMARRQDQLRINDLNQIMVALKLYSQQNGSFPTSLQSLLNGRDVQVLSAIPTDPATGQSYLYSTSSDGGRYHIGAPLRDLSRIDVISDDANFNSRGQGFSNGFNGATADCGRSSASDAITCFDMTGSTE